MQASHVPVLARKYSLSQQVAGGQSKQSADAAGAKRTCSQIGQKIPACFHPFSCHLLKASAEFSGGFFLLSH